MMPTLTVEEIDRLAAACDVLSRRYGDYVRRQRCSVSVRVSRRRFT